MDSVCAHFLTPKCHKHTGQLTHAHAELHWAWCGLIPRWADQFSSESLSITPPFLFMFSTFQSQLDVIVLLPSELARATCHPFCSLTKCGFHLSDVVLICSLSPTAFSSYCDCQPAFCEVRRVIQMPLACSGIVYLENWHSHCLNNLPVKCTASFNCWSLKWGSIKMNDLH